MLIVENCKSFLEYFSFYGPEQFKYDLWNHRIAENFYGFLSPSGERNGKTRYIKG